MKDNVIFWRDWDDAIRSLPDNEQAEAYRAVMDYAMNGVPYSGSNGAVRMLMQFIAPKIDEAKVKYDAVCERNRSNGLKGGRPCKTEKPSETQKNPVGLNDEEKNPEKPDIGYRIKDKGYRIKDKGYNIKEKKLQLENRKQVFYDSLIPYINIYGKDMMREFFDYWTEPNKSKTKMRYDLEKTWDLNRRLNLWASNEKIYKRNGNNRTSSNGDYQAAERAEEAAAIMRRLAAEDDAAHRT